MDSKLGYYTVIVYAEDSLGNEGEKNDTIMLAYSYNITLLLDPNPVVESGKVKAEGKVKMDDGTPVPEKKINLTLPNSTVEVNLVNGTFSYVFNVSANEGTYDVIVSVLSMGNNLVYSVSKKLEVINPTSTKKRAGGSGGGAATQGSGSGGSSGTGSTEQECVDEWSCGEWSSCSNGESARTCTSTCGNSKINKKSCEAENTTGNDANGENSAQVESEEGTSQSRLGLGSGSGLFNLKSNWALLLLAIIIIAGITAFLAKIGWRRDEEETLDEYLERIRSREG